MNNYDLLQNILKYVSKQIEDNQFNFCIIASILPITFPSPNLCIAVSNIFNTCPQNNVHLSNHFLSTHSFLEVFVTLPSQFKSHKRVIRVSFAFCFAAFSASTFFSPVSHSGTLNLSTSTCCKTVLACSNSLVETHAT